MLGYFWEIDVGKLLLYFRMHDHVNSDVQTTSTITHKRRKSVLLTFDSARVLFSALCVCVETPSFV